MATFTPRQKNWKFYENNAAEPTVQVAAENTTAPVNIGNIYRLRLQIHETGGKQGTNNSFKLQYSTDDTNFTDLGGANVWNYANGAGTNGNATTSYLLTSSNAHGKYIEDASQTQTVGASSYTEIDVAIQSVSAAIHTTYYFRAILAGSELLKENPPNTHPSVTTFATYTKTFTFGTEPKIVSALKTWTFGTEPKIVNATKTYTFATEPTSLATYTKTWTFGSEPQLISALKTFTFAAEPQLLSALKTWTFGVEPKLVSALKTFTFATEPALISALKQFTFGTEPQAGAAIYTKTWTFATEPQLLSVLAQWTFGTEPQVLVAPPVTPTEAAVYARTRRDFPLTDEQIRLLLQIIELKQNE